MHFHKNQYNGYLLTMKDNHYDIIESLAVLSRDNIEFSNVRISACIVHKGEIISYGFNQRKTHPVQAKFNKDTNRFKIHLHAEIDAILKASRYSPNLDLSKCSIYIVRILRNNKIALAKPCIGCQKAIKHYSIKEVFYSIGEKEYGHIQST